MPRFGTLRKAAIVLVAAISGAVASQVVRAGPRGSEWFETYRVPKLEFLVVSANAASTTCAHFNRLARDCLDYQYIMAGPAKVVLAVFTPPDTSIAEYEKTVEEAKKLLLIQAEGFFPGRRVPPLDIEIRRQETKP